MATELYIWPHARRRMSQRGITEDDIRRVLADPQITRPGSKPNRTVYEADLGTMICVVTVDNSDPIQVVTAFARR